MKNFITILFHFLTLVYQAQHNVNRTLCNISRSIRGFGDPFFLEELF